MPVVSQTRGVDEYDVATTRNLRILRGGHPYALSTLVHPLAPARSSLANSPPPFAPLPVCSQAAPHICDQHPEDHKVHEDGVRGQVCSRRTSAPCRQGRGAYPQLARVKPCSERSGGVYVGGRGSLPGFSLSGRVDGGNRLPAGKEDLAHRGISGATD